MVRVTEIADQSHAFLQGAGFSFASCYNTPMPSERDNAGENPYDAPEQSRFPLWMLIVAVIAALVAIPVLIILAIDLRRLFLD